MRLRSSLPILLTATLISCSPSADRPLQPKQQPAGWRALAQVPTPRTEVAAAASGGQIYVAGGFISSGDSTSIVEIYQPSRDSWARGPDLPIALNHAMAAGGDTVYVAGGYRQGLAEPSDRAFRLEGERWVDLPRMPEARAAGGAAIVDGLLYVAGGVGPRGLAETMMVFDPKSSRWSNVQGPGVRREHLAVAGGEGSLFVLGGRTGGIGSNLDDAEVYDTAGGTWKQIPPLPTARGGSAGAYWDGGIAISAGGEADTTFDEVEGYMVSSGTWRALPGLPTPRHGLGVVVLDGVLYVLAGGPTPGLSVSGANEALDLSRAMRMKGG